jgi:hypothetical protein
MLPAINDGVEDRLPDEKPQWEVADIFRQHGEPYRLARQMPQTHLKVMHDIETCRTSSLGGHIEKCDACGFERNAYNSCRNRHCPKCQALTKARWLQARMAELLPVTYFHNVFTLPHLLNPLVLCNKKILFDILFKSASETLLKFGRNSQNGLGGKMGFIAILHTWDQTLLDHFHLHYLIAAGALSLDHSRWIAAKENFLFNVEALSKVFRGKFMDYFEQAKDELIFPGNSHYLGTEKGFSQLKAQLWEKKWVVYSKKPFAGPEQVLEYLGRYTHRVAISNHRLVAVDNTKVSFKYRDRKDNDTLKIITLNAAEFVRRFLLHVLPDGFMRIRHFGFLANRCKSQTLSRCRKLMGLPAQLPQSPTKTTAELMLELTGIDLTKCPICQNGIMRILASTPEVSAFNLQKYHKQTEILDH